MHVFNHSTESINFNSNVLPEILRGWEHIKKFEPALADLECQALAMRSTGDLWWQRSRLIINQLRLLVGPYSSKPILRNPYVVEITEKAIWSAFYHKEPAE